MNSFRICFVVCALLIVSGCGKSGPAPTASLSGKVTIDGAPAPTGSQIHFTDSASGNVAIGVIRDGGAYTATLNGQEKVFPGDYKVTVSGPAVEVDAEAAMEPDFVPPTNPIPEKYQDASTSGETVTVTEGENTYNLDISS